MLPENLLQAPVWTTFDIALVLYSRNHSSKLSFVLTRGQIYSSIFDWTTLGFAWRQ